jgi:hypothetical protein
MSPLEYRRRRISDLVGEADVPVKNKVGRPRKDGSTDPRPPKPKRPPGRPRKEVSASQQAPVPDDDDGVESATLSSKDVSEFLLYGVSVQQLCRIFRMTRQGVENKLRNLRPIELGSHGNPVYDLADAASYLIDPAIDIEEYLRGIKPEKLPDHLRETFWNAKLKRQRYEENAGDLWRTKKVMEVVGELLLDFSNKLNLIPDLVERQTGFSPEQYRLVRAIVDGIREEMVDDAERLKRGEEVGSQLTDQEESEP